MVLVVIHLLLRNSHALLEGNGILVVSSLNVLQELSTLRGLFMMLPVFFKWFLSME